MKAALSLLRVRLHTGVRFTTQACKAASASSWCVHTSMAPALCLAFETLVIDVVTDSHMMNCALRESGHT
jgi:hypothetical protein